MSCCSSCKGGGACGGGRAMTVYASKMPVSSMRQTSIGVTRIMPAMKVAPVVSDASMRLSLMREMRGAR